jgi:hypothetical protein
LQEGAAQGAVLQQVAVAAGGGKLLKALEVVRGGVALQIGSARTAAAGIAVSAKESQDDSASHPLHHKEEKRVADRYAVGNSDQLNAAQHFIQQAQLGMLLLLLLLPCLGLNCWWCTPWGLWPSRA